MAQQKSSPRRRSRVLQSGSTAGDQQDIPGSGNARRFLKHLDRHLQRLGSRIDVLRESADRLSNEEERDLISAIESLNRETLGLRAEIREHLTGGKRKPVEMMEYAEEAWDQLRESFTELKESFEPAMTARVRSEGRRRPDDDGEDEDGEWLGNEWPRDDGDE